MLRAGLVLTMSAIASFGLVTPVLAAAPGNDLYAGRTVIPAIPFTDSVDVSEATTDADDVELNGQCGAPATDASVWYEYTADADGQLVAETLEADYAVGVIVATGSPGAFSVVTCYPFNVSFAAFAGETYTILYFNFGGEEGGPGSSLSMRLRALPPPPEIELTLSSTGSFDAMTGAATIRGTVTCTGGDDYTKAAVDVQVSQQVGRFQVNGWGNASLDCDGTTHAWAAEVFADNGKFAGGKASVHVFAFVCTESGCDETELNGTVTLRR